MPKKRNVPSVFLWLLSAAPLLVMPGCESRGESSSYAERADRAPTGQLSLALLLPGGLQVDAVRYEITGNGVTLTDTLLVPGSSLDFTAVITDIPVGTNYTLRLTALPLGDAGISCVGTAQFSITRDATTQVNVVLSCDEADHSGAAMINGTINVCPHLRSTIITPVSQRLGEPVALRVIADDPDLAPQPLSYSWSSSAGTFTNGNTATPTFRCAQAGATTISVRVSDGLCPKTDTVSLSCVAGGGGSYSGGPCEESETRYLSALRDDPIMAQLASCTADTDCATYDRTAECANGAVHSGCSGATNRTNVAQAEARKAVIVATTYCAPDAPRCINYAQCLSNTLRCVEGRCAYRWELPDAGL